MFLVLCGIDPADDSVESIPCGAEGASLLQLSRFAGTHGVPTEVRLYKPSEFQRIPLPAICQTRGGRLKHFVVAYDVDSNGIDALDSTTGKYVRVRKGRMESFLSGYALVPRPSIFLSSQHWLCMCLVSANIALLWEKRRHVIGTQQPVSHCDGIAGECVS